MSRQIDLTKKLSEEDREYLLARGREQQVFANDAQFTGDPEAMRFTATVPGMQVDRADGVPPTPGGDPLVVMGGGHVVDTPEFENDPNAAVDGEAPDAGVGALATEPNEVDEDTDDNYDEWTKEELEEELGNRNLSKSGKKADQIKRLRENDAEEA